jgi:hypothetical protein
VHFVAGGLRARLRVLLDGKQGFNRNLTTAEMVGQLWHANPRLLADGS